MDRQKRVGGHTDGRVPNTSSSTEFKGFSPSSLSSPLPFLPRKGPVFGRSGMQ